jgi:lipopolysaccharide export system permease protein
MQFLWKYVDDLIGKGLDKGTLAELFFYATLTTFPLALPLSVLLSSLMTYGNLGEHFELVAMKSSGISLQKIMLPILFVAIITSIAAFIFANNFLPYINLKMSTLLYDIQQKKPALKIKEGIFYNGIDGYTIRIERKESDGNTCHGIMIYDHTQGVGNNKVIIAESGKLELTPDKQFLLMTLFNGTSYEEMMDSKQEHYHPFVRSKFKQQTVRFDLSGFRLMRTDEGLFRSNYAMMNIKQIEKMIDSLTTEKEKKISEFKNTLFTQLSRLNKTSNLQNVGLVNREGEFGSILPHHILTSSTGSRIIGSKIKSSHIYSVADTSFNIREKQSRIIETALSIARSRKYIIESSLNERENYDNPITYLKVEWHKKFTLSLACVILFFIGAPLGAIIRKGGLGMPVVVSVIIFILFWVISISGEKMSKEEFLPPYIGMWIATAVTLPFGIFLTRKATSDSSLFDINTYLGPFGKK